MRIGGDAYKINEVVRKGLLARGKANDELENFFKELVKPLGDWYFDYCSKIRYMFLKAHAAASVMNAVRCAWFKKILSQ